jgi:hypothetical protein
MAVPVHCLPALADIDRIANSLAVAEHVKSARSLVFTTTVRLLLRIKSPYRPSRALRAPLGG